MNLKLIVEYLTSNKFVLVFGCLKISSMESIAFKNTRLTSKLGEHRPLQP